MDPDSDCHALRLRKNQWRDPLREAEALQRHPDGNPSGDERHGGVCFRELSLKLIVRVRSGEVARSCP